MTINDKQNWSGSSHSDAFGFLFDVLSEMLGRIGIGADIDIDLLVALPSLHAIPQTACSTQPMDHVMLLSTIF